MTIETGNVTQKMLDSVQLILYTMHIDLHSITGDTNGSKILTDTNADHEQLNDILETVGRTI